MLERVDFLLEDKIKEAQKRNKLEEEGKVLIYKMLPPKVTYMGEKPEKNSFGVWSQGSPYVYSVCFSKFFKRTT